MRVALASEAIFRHDRAMPMRLKALLVHLLTASGAVLSMLAMLAAVDRQWSMMFLWLLVALIVQLPAGMVAGRSGYVRH